MKDGVVLLAMTTMRDGDDFVDLGGEKPALEVDKEDVKVVEAKFLEAAREWVDSCEFYSGFSMSKDHPCFAQLVQLGIKGAFGIPWTLDCYEGKPPFTRMEHGYWFLVLAELTHQSPYLDVEERLISGREAEASDVTVALAEVRKAWLRWGGRL